MWEMIILPFGSNEFLLHLDNGWEPFATAILPSTSGLAVPSNHSPMTEILAMVSLRRYVDERFIGEN